VTGGREGAFRYTNRSEQENISAMPAKIAIMGYHAFTEFLLEHPLLLALPGVDVHIESSCLDDALPIAQRLEDSREIDVFVSSGANGRMLSKY
jgi:hypothetical protein